MHSPVKKILSLLLSAAILLCTVSLAFALETKKSDIPVIFIKGFVSSATVDSVRGEQLFPPDGEKILSVVKDSILPVAGSLVTRNYEALRDPMEEILYGIFDPIRCDENGDPVIASTTSSYVWPNEDEVLAKYSDELGFTATDPFYYSFDWRLDLKTLAEELHSFLKYVTETAGSETANVIGSSMGACVLVTYMDMYGCEYLENVAFMSGAFAGASIAGEPMIGNYGFDAEGILTFISGVNGQDLKGEIIDALVDVLYQQGIVKDLTDVLNNISEYVLKYLTGTSLAMIFGRMPGFWSLVPAQYYDEAKENMLPGIVSDEFIEKIDFYHDIQGRVPEILENAIDTGINVSILSKYSMNAIPAVPTQKNLTDMIVDTKYSSLGATCADIDKPFDESYVQAVDNGHDHLSCDGYIDASTCVFPEYTWFLKNERHTIHPESQLRFLDALFASETQPTVWDMPEYPQFLVFNASRELVPLTEETDVSIVRIPEIGENFLERFRKILEDFWKIFKAMFEMMRSKIAQ